MSEKLGKYVSDLCDKYSHFGEFLVQEFADVGKARTGREMTSRISLAMIQKLYKGKVGVGCESSKALGEVLGMPIGHYETLYKLFKAEKDRRSKL